MLKKIKTFFQEIIKRWNKVQLKEEERNFLKCQKCEKCSEKIS